MMGLLLGCASATARRPSLQPYVRQTYLMFDALLLLLSRTLQGSSPPLPLLPSAAAAAPAAGVGVVSKSPQQYTSSCRGGQSNRSDVLYSLYCAASSFDSTQASSICVLGEGWGVARQACLDIG